MAFAVAQRAVARGGSGLSAQAGVVQGNPAAFLLQVGVGQPDVHFPSTVVFELLQLQVLVAVLRYGEAVTVAEFGLTQRQALVPAAGGIGQAPIAGVVAAGEGRLLLAGGVVVAAIGAVV